MKNDFRRGFTLIELLVVVAIIGILSSIVLSNLMGARVKSRDVTRKQNLDQLVKATNLYYSQNGELPGVGGECYHVLGSSPDSGISLATDLDPFMKDIPVDPMKGALGLNGNYVYNNVADDTGSFNFCAIMENAGTGNGSYTDMCGDGTTYNYCVTQ
ncbi:MAG: hypothetical protein A2566_01360 [Candidatus Zambryskibacteria bacterium RIFOXYD1_FULL_40_13]|nr:MAG: hypothetical protein UT25_C0005G0013 [Parcubacteria group bacterium GW2011_GWC1_39_12]KKR34868.1 MAG: hypothetical protein UT68_C0007G0019 [Parcubacteria group bacterium GW2011_GWC2_40_10]KKR52139.1 MAG: hypothetical protein UT89_C0003G0075 [Parcubacteria group bacterium GW2011_GWE1_40_20]KKR68637.1 MAG: hypothetical protein UU11_C0008G0012 [Parcubacteria group bacterium GW2011_GWF2_40_69]KKR81125.1 MAG: hypothetical protein UU27_C0016G0004 [Parcubacteria group bacterium GW2011_GWD1_40_